MRRHCLGIDQNAGCIEDTPAGSAGVSLCYGQKFADIKNTKKLTQTIAHLEAPKKAKFAPVRAILVKNG